ncbi:MAG: arginine--tRNA ligase, partial [candidate division WOR-3 bacterium]|nr:arginine--tRNA ligase [candidate division WOR-3 bacterium]
MLSKKIIESLKNAQIEIPEGHEIEFIREEKFGDCASNVLFLLSKKFKKSVQELGKEFLENVKTDTDYEKVEIGGKGFLNFTFSFDFLRKELRKVFSEDYLSFNIGKKRKVNLEFISANPTGPLSVVQARAGAYGNSLANLLRFVNYDVFTEYYINDCGTQIDLLEKSLVYRIDELKGIKSEFPKGGYPGEYLIEIAKKILANNLPRDKWRSFLLNEIISWQKEVLNKFGINFDSFVYESSIIQHREKILEILKDKNLVYEKDGALFFKSSLFGDSEDRVLITKDKRATYFLNDLAYHYDKIKRGFEIIINIWGPDHHGYIPRMAAGIKSLGFDTNNFLIIIAQQVSLERGGEKIKMSKRGGEFITLEEVLEEIGSDPLKFFLLLRKPSQHLTFDLELIKKATKENPYFYVQYAYARICSIERYGKEKGYDFDKLLEDVNLEYLKTKEERSLMLTILKFKDIIIQAVKEFAPHILVYYLLELTEK